MRICKSKADLKKSTKVDFSTRNTDFISSCTVLDGCALLWTVAWPSSSATNPAIVRDYVDSFTNILKHRLKNGDVYLVFDRYIDFSTKYSARKARGPGGCRVFQLSSNSSLPPQEQVLKVPENKRQLIQIIVDTLISEGIIPGGYHNRLIVTGQDDTPVEIAPNHVVIQRHDLRTTHEEADIIVVAQAIYAAKEEKKYVTVVADDTDVYLLLLHHYNEHSLDIRMKLEPTQIMRASIDVKASVHQLKGIITELLPAHALSGCDTVPMLYGIGKGKMLKAVKSGTCSLSLLGNMNSNLENVINQASAFMCHCYNVEDSLSMTEARIRIWTIKTGKKSAVKIPKLCSLPPTTEAFVENVKRAHYQCAIWKSLDNPPNLDPTNLGWIKDIETKSLLPTTLPPTRKAAPDYVLKLVSCSCASETPCRTKICGCVAANLPCTIFCRCQGNVNCKNEQTNAEESDEELEV